MFGSERETTSINRIKANIDLSLASSTPHKRGRQLVYLVPEPQEPLQTRNTF